MIKEEKTIFVSVLTVLLLGFSNFLTTGKLLFTFPLNDYLLLLIGTYIAFFSYKKEKAIVLTLVLFFIINLLSQLYNYEFFLSQEQLSWLSNSIITDLFQLISYLLYMLIFLFMYLKSKNVNLLFCILLFIISILFVELLSLPVLSIIAFLGPLVWITFFINKIKKKFYFVYLLLFLHVFLLSTKFYTLYIA
jgi:hypothetical protein